MKLNKKERDFLLFLLNDYEIRNILGLCFSYDKEVSFLSSLVRKLKNNIEKEC